MADKAEFGNNSSKICPGCMVGIPTMGLVDAEFMLSIANMQLPLNWRGGNFILRGKPVDAARNELVEIALRQGFEWLFFRDDDVIAPPDALNKLYSLHTPIAAGVILLVEVTDGEPGAEIYGAAAEYRQACLVFEHARGMVLQEPELSRRLKVFNGQQKAITCEDQFTAYRVISSEAYSNHGTIHTSR